MMGYADELETTVLELTYNYGVTEYTKGNAYAQVNLSYTFLPPLFILNGNSFYFYCLLVKTSDYFVTFQVAIGTDDVYKSAEVVNQVNQELGGKITRQPGPLPGIGTKIVGFLDPDGWKTVSSTLF